jgi:hypothetical protein
MKDTVNVTSPTLETATTQVGKHEGGNATRATAMKREIINTQKKQ